MNREEMIRNYELTSAADAYIIGFSVGTDAYIIKMRELRDDMVALSRESSKNGGAAKIRLSITARLKKILLNAGAVRVCKVDEILSLENNTGEDFERWDLERNGQTWKRDRTPYWKDGDITVNGQKLQLKWENASLTNEDTIARAMTALAVA